MANLKIALIIQIGYSTSHLAVHLTINTANMNFTYLKLAHYNIAHLNIAIFKTAIRKIARHNIVHDQKSFFIG